MFRGLTRGTRRGYGAPCPFPPLPNRLGETRPTYFFVLLRVLGIPLLHHFPLPPFLLQRLLDELSHLALLARLFSPNQEPKENERGGREGDKSTDLKEVGQRTRSYAARLYIHTHIYALGSKRSQHNHVSEL